MACNCNIRGKIGPAFWSCMAFGWWFSSISDIPSLPRKDNVSWLDSTFAYCRIPWSWTIEITTQDLLHERLWGNAYIIYMFLVMAEACKEDTGFPHLKKNTIHWHQELQNWRNRHGVWWPRHCDIDIAGSGSARLACHCQCCWKGIAGNSCPKYEKLGCFWQFMDYFQQQKWGCERVQISNAVGKQPATIGRYIMRTNNYDDVMTGCGEYVYIFLSLLGWFQLIYLRLCPPSTHRSKLHGHICCLSLSRGQTPPPSRCLPMAALA